MTLRKNIIRNALKALLRNVQSAIIDIWQLSYNHTTQTEKVANALRNGDSIDVYYYCNRWYNRLCLRWEKQYCKICFDRGEVSIYNEYWQRMDQNHPWYDFLTGEAYRLENASGIVDMLWDADIKLILERSDQFYDNRIKAIRAAEAEEAIKILEQKEQQRLARVRAHEEWEERNKVDGEGYW